MNIFSIIYIFTTIIIFVLIFLFFKSSKDKYNLFKIYDDNNDNDNSIYDINNHGHENDKALQNWKYRRLHKKYSNYHNNNSDKINRLSS